MASTQACDCLSPLLLNGQPVTEADAEGVSLAEFGVALSANFGVDPFDELSFWMAGVAHVDEVVVSAVSGCAVTCQAWRQSQLVERGALHATVKQCRVRINHELFKRHVLQSDCPLISIVEFGNVLDEQNMIDDLEVAALGELDAVQEVVPVAIRPHDSHATGVIVQDFTSTFGDPDDRCWHEDRLALCGDQPAKTTAECFRERLGHRVYVFGGEDGAASQEAQQVQHRTIEHVPEYDMMRLIEDKGLVIEIVHRPRGPIMLNGKLHKVGIYPGMSRKLQCRIEIGSHRDPSGLFQADGSVELRDEFDHPLLLENHG